MTTLIPKYYEGASGSVNIPISTKLAQTVSVIDFGADPTGSADSTTAIQNAINAAATTTGIVTFPVGTFKITAAIDLKGKYVTLQGAGMINTIIKASGTFTNMIDIFDTTDVTVSPFNIKDLKLDGNNTVTNAISIQYRHEYTIENINIINVQYGLNKQNAWLGYHKNIVCTATHTGFNIVGSCHANSYVRCSINGFNTFGVVINNAALGDGNQAVLFSECDIEYGATGGGACYINAGPSSITFDTCYIGESVSGPVFSIVDSTILIQGGYIVYGTTSSSIGFTLTNGSAVRVEKSFIISGAALDLSGLVYATPSTAPAVDGRISFIDVFLETSVSGNTTSTGDFLNFGPIQTTYVTRYGKNFTSNFTNCTGTASNYLNGQTIAISTIASSPRAEIYASLINIAEHYSSATEKDYLVVIYESNVAVNVTLSGGVGGTSPSKLVGTMPASSGNTNTYFCINQNLFDAAYTTLEFWITPTSTSNTFTIQEVYFADQHMLASDPSSSNVCNNLYKC